MIPRRQNDFVVRMRWRVVARHGAGSEPDLAATASGLAGGAEQGFRPAHILLRGDFKILF
jgi:hypothetical protein